MRVSTLFESSSRRLSTVFCLSIAFIVGVVFFHVDRKNSTKILRSLKSSDVSLSPVSSNEQEDVCAEFIAPQLTSDDRAKMKPVWVPGYPGSGSELLLRLVSATTGHKASNVYAHKCKDCVVSCKTHFPFIGISSPVELQSKFHSKFMLLMRNPAKALPSYFNWIWERHNSIEDHTRQAPEEAWREWRDEHFSHELSKWKKMIEWWTSGTYQLHLLIPYEQLISVEQGPSLLHQLTQTFHTLNNLTVAENAECMWHDVITNGKMHRKDHSYKPGYTTEQKRLMREMLQNLSVQFRDTPLLSEWLNRYHDEVEESVPTDNRAIEQTK